METIRHVTDPNNPRYDDFLPNVASIVTAHEALHRFFGWHGDNPESDANIMNDTQYSALRAIGNRNLTPTQYRMIQNTDYPK